MGMTWHSKAEILTTDNDRLSKIFDWLKSYSNNKKKLYELNKGDCSILFSSIGYGSFGSIEVDPFRGNLFQEICEEFDFPILCHERVLPCQSQGFGFIVVFGKWMDEIIRSYKEIVYEYYEYPPWYGLSVFGSDGDINAGWANSAQIVCFTSDELPKELDAVIKRASKAEKSIESSEPWWDYEDGGTNKVFYCNDFIDNCIDEDFDLVNEIFFKRFSNSCTWEPDLFDWFTDSLSYEDGDNEIEKLGEEIDEKKIRLKPTMK